MFFKTVQRTKTQFIRRNLFTPRKKQFLGLQKKKKHNTDIVCIIRAQLLQNTTGFRSGVRRMVYYRSNIISYLDSKLLKSLMKSQNNMKIFEKLLISATTEV